MVDKTMLKRKIKKVTRIMGEIKEDQGSNNKLYRAYQRKIDRYNDLLDDASEEDSVLHGSADEASVLSPPQSQDIESDAEDEGHETETDDEPEEEAPKKKKKKKKVAVDGEEAPKKKKKKKKPVDGEEVPKKKKKKKKPKDDE